MYANRYDSVWPLLLPQLEHLEILNVKITTFGKCVSKYATMVLPIFGFYFKTFFFLIVHSVVVQC